MEIRRNSTADEKALVPNGRRPGTSIRISLQNGRRSALEWDSIPATGGGSAFPYTPRHTAAKSSLGGCCSVLPTNRVHSGISSGGPDHSRIFVNSIAQCALVSHSRMPMPATNYPNPPRHPGIRLWPDSRTAMPTANNCA